MGIGMVSAHFGGAELSSNLSFGVQSHASLGSDDNMSSGFFLSGFVLEASLGYVTALGLKCLQCLSEHASDAIYWSYICARGRHLNLPVDAMEELALVRLACLSNCSDVRQSGFLIDAWDALDVVHQNILTKNLVADGTRKKALIFEGLPKCFKNILEQAKDDEHQVQRTTDVLGVIADLVEMVNAREANEHHVTIVEISELAKFIRDEKSSNGLRMCLERAKLMPTATGFRVIVSSKKNVVDSDAANVNQSLKHISRKLRNLEFMMARRRAPSKPQPENSTSPTHYASFKRVSLS